MSGAERVVQLRLGEKVIVQAVPFPILERRGRREDQRPAFEELERYVGLHWEQIRYLRGGKVDDAADLATEKDTFPLIETLKQFNVTSDEIERETQKILLKCGLSDREASLHAQALNDFLQGFEI